MEDLVRIGIYLLNVVVAALPSLPSMLRVMVVTPGLHLHSSKSLADFGAFERLYGAVDAGSGLPSSMAVSHMGLMSTQNVADIN